MFGGFPNRVDVRKGRKLPYFVLSANYIMRLNLKKDFTLLSGNSFIVIQQINIITCCHVHEPCIFFLSWKKTHTIEKSFTIYTDSNPFTMCCSKNAVGHAFVDEHSPS